MKIESHLESLSSSAELLSSLTFTHPVAFQNTLLSKRDITAVIRDAEPHESKLFMLNPETNEPTKKTSKTINNRAATEILRQRQDSNGPDVNVLLAAAEQLLQVYPVDSDTVQAEIDLIRHKYTTIGQSIQHLERDVEIQRRKLDALATGRDYNEDEDEDDAPGLEQSIVTEEMIDLEEQEIKRLEALIEQKGRQ